MTGSYFEQVYLESYRLSNWWNVENSLQIVVVSLLHCIVPVVINHQPCTWHALWMRRHGMYVCVCGLFLTENRFVYTSHKRVACHAQRLPETNKTRKLFRVFEWDWFVRAVIKSNNQTTLLTVHNFRFNTTTEKAA